MAVFTSVLNDDSSEPTTWLTGIDMLSFSVHNFDLHLLSVADVEDDLSYYYSGAATPNQHAFSWNPSPGSIDYTYSDSNFGGSGLTYTTATDPQGVERSVLTGGMVSALGYAYTTHSDGGITWFGYSLSWSLTGFSVNVQDWLAATEQQRFDLIFAGADSVSGTAYDDTLASGAGNDTLNGGLGADIMHGGTGNDTYYFDNSGDRAIEATGQGFDTVYTSASISLGPTNEIELLRTTNPNGTTLINLAGSNSANTIIGNAAVNRISGGASNDTVSALGGNDIIDGGTGADRMAGGTGDDLYYVDNAADLIIDLIGEGALDHLIASVSYRIANGVGINVMTAAATGGAVNIGLRGNDFAQRLNGNGDANALSGLGENDTIFGLGGNDALIGGLGRDTLSGGTGLDNFYFDSTLNASTNVDTITDFSVAEDTMRLENAVFTGLATGFLSATALRIGAAAADADDRIIYNSTTGNLSFDADGNGATAAIHFATLAAGLALTRGDFLVY